MKVAVDSSSLAKRYVQEFGSGKIDRILERASDLGFCVILVPEIISGLNRRLKEGALNSGEYRAIKRQLLEDVQDSTVLQITPSVIAHSVRLLEDNTLRALDSLHIACALEWGADVFVTSDKRQLSAAMNAGLRTEYVG